MNGEKAKGQKSGVKRLRNHARGGGCLSNFCQGLVLVRNRLSQQVIFHIYSTDLF